MGDREVIGDVGKIGKHELSNASSEKGKCSGRELSTLIFFIREKRKLKRSVLERKIGEHKLNSVTRKGNVLTP